ncbi:YagK/YfjJ domain-containing protein [Shewanella psychrotolerans]|uniref:YagK/YfjJ domain-containing protein n=1 Tax=Shewanella psychrotolerans TaxID=2864206 RepID=UPI001C658F0B|nr:inovirus-type Gp2 protein [Shewanella psychrotolerans]QYK02410.1 inovirus Gp2 family protein [Shewanella psychrotolerans]
MFITYADYYHYAGNDWKINNKPSGCALNIISSLFKLIFNYQADHYRILAIRYDLHQPSYVDNNKRMTVFFRRLNKQLNAKYAGVDMKYAWVREQAAADSPHFHILLLLNGQVVNHPHKVSQVCKRIWSDMSGTIYYPKNMYYLVTRNDLTRLEQLLFRVSYFAKGKDKDKRAAQTKSFGCSRSL